MNKDVLTERLTLLLSTLNEAYTTGSMTKKDEKICQAHGIISTIREYVKNS